MRGPGILTVCLIFAAIGLARAGEELRQVDVFVSGTDGYFGYRIPAIETAADGSLVAFCEARKYNLADPGFGKQDIDLVSKRSTDGGLTWSPMRVIEDPGELWSAANPATVLDRQTGRLWLFYIRSKPERSTGTARPGTDDMQNLARWSDDHGVTWSDPIDQTAVARDMADPKWRASVVGPGGAIQLRSGRLIAPVWKVEPYDVFAIFSDDHGRTWQRGQVVPGGQPGDESELVELSDGAVLIDIRQGSGPHRYRATSRDGGQTWADPVPGEAVTPVACAIERWTLPSDGGDRIVWTGPKGPGRTNLVARISRDGAKTFPIERPISTGHAAYSELTVLPDRSVGVLWERGAERGYQFITFTRLTRDFLEPGQ
jgi:sialidase-1